jgi:hypothetical protein
MVYDLIVPAFAVVYSFIKTDSTQSSLNRRDLFIRKHEWVEVVYVPENNNWLAFLG